MASPFVFAYTRALEKLMRPVAPKHRAVPGPPIPATPTTGLSTLLPLNSGGLGMFPWRWEVAAGFNHYTYLYLDNTFSIDTNGMLVAGNSWLTDYASVIQATNFPLSSADLHTLSAGESLRQGVISTITSSFTQQFGPVTSIMLKAAERELGLSVPTPFDYILLYEIAYLWSARRARGAPPLPLNKLIGTLQPMTLLPAAPPSAIGLVNNVIVYLNGFSASVTIMDKRGHGVATLNDVLDFILHPSGKNGATTTIDNQGTTTLKPAWAPGLSVEALKKSLLSGSSQSSISFQAKLDGLGSLSVKFQSGQGFTARADLVSFNSDDGQKFDLFSLPGTGSLSVTTKVFKGKTTLALAPTAYDFSTRTGWYDPAIIRQAVINQGRDVSGYEFLPKPTFNFQPRGNFGRLAELVISQFPEVHIVYSSGDLQSFLKVFPPTRKWNINFSGLPQAGGGAFPYRATAVSQGSGFTVNFVPAEPFQDTGSLQDTAYVIGGRVAWVM